MSIRRGTLALLLTAYAGLPAACAAGVVTETEASGGGGEGGGAGGSGGANDAGPPDAAPAEAGPLDAGLADAPGPVDAGPPDAAPVSCTTAADCAALNGPCALGACQNGSCVLLPANDFGSCNDGLFCTESDTCQNGVCVGGNQKYCPSPDECHIAVCDEATQGCKTVPGNDGAQCDDGDPCTYMGACGGGACSKGKPIDCTLFDSQCTKGVCDPQGGCVSMPANEGKACDDGQYCTVKDACKNGTCGGVPNTCAAPDDVCMIGTCNEAADTCVAVPGNEGKACDDGNDCTEQEACSAGKCVGGKPANDGKKCDDGDACTGGTTCQNGQCDDPTSQITQCIDNDACCPENCMVDKDCLYWKPGVQKDVPEQDLVGWTKCWSGTYDQSQPALSQILQTCGKEKLLLACRPLGAQAFTLLAMGPRLDVLFDCGSQNDCTKQSNGVGWYYSTSYSWGFAPGGQSVNRSSCDYNDGNQVMPELRMCWHTGGGSINSGYRCGSNDLNGASKWERLVFHAD